MKNNKFICFFVLVSVSFFLVNMAYSHDHHHIESTETTISAGTANGASLAIAMSQLSFDWSTKAYQAGIGLGSFNGADAISLGFGKRVDRMLINGSIGREGDQYGYGLGISFHF